MHVKNLEKTETRELTTRKGFRLDFPESGGYNRYNPRETMKIELTPENAAALAKYAALAGHTPAEFLHEYLSDNMVALFENLRTGDLESHLCSLEFHTRVDAERVVAWMEIQVTERSEGRTAFEAEIFEDPEKGCFWIEATTIANGLTYPRLDSQARTLNSEPVSKTQPLC